MKLIRKTRTKITKNGNKVIYGIFKCPDCLQEVEKYISNGKRDKSCGCKMTPYWKGGKLTEETKQKMSKAKRGKISPRKGKKNTEEHKQKIRENHVDFNGKNHPMYGKHLKEKTKQKIREANIGKTGELASNWQGGKSFEEYGVEFNKDLKQQIKERDAYICQSYSCEYRTNILDIHHIDYDKKNNNIENLITLCRSCHMKTNSKNNRQYFTELYQNIMIKDLTPTIFKDSGIYK